MNIKCIMLALVAIVAMNGCTTINIIFTGSDSGPMAMGDAGVPMGDTGVPIVDDAAPMPLVDAGSDAGPTDEPTLVVNADNLRPSTILVAGGGAWHNVAQYRVRPSVDSTLQCVRVQIDGDAADIEQFAIAQDGMVMGLGILPSGMDTGTVACLSIPIVMHEMEDSIFQIWVRLPEVVPGSSVSGASDGVLRSGDRFRMGIDYVDFLATGAGPATFPTIWGDEFQVRRTRPTVTHQSLSTTTLANGLDQDLYRFQVSTDSAGSLALHTIALNVVLDGSGPVALSNFRLRKGSTDMALTDYQIIDQFGRDIRSGRVELSETDAWDRFVIVFSGEELVSGSGNVYTLHATPSDVDPGDQIEVYFDRTEGQGSTGYLRDDVLHFSLDASPWGSPGTTPPVVANFIWSDLSETLHSHYYGCCGGSRDWTDGYLIEDLTQTQTLTR